MQFRPRPFHFRYSTNDVLERPYREISVSDSDYVSFDNLFTWPEIFGCDDTDPEKRCAFGCSDDAVAAAGSIPFAGLGYLCNCTASGGDNSTMQVLRCRGCVCVSACVCVCV